jgi:hypothetical protein
MVPCTFMCTRRLRIIAYNKLMFTFVLCLTCPAMSLVRDFRNSSMTPIFILLSLALSSVAAADGATVYTTIGSTFSDSNCTQHAVAFAAASEGGGVTTCTFAGEVYVAALCSASPVTVRKGYSDFVVNGYSDSACKTWAAASTASGIVGDGICRKISAEPDVWMLVTACKDSSAGRSSRSTGLIVGLCVGAFVAVLVIGAIVRKQCCSDQARSLRQSRDSYGSGGWQPQLDGSYQPPAAKTGATRSG